MMGALASNSRRQVEARFPSPVVVLVMIAAIFLQSLLPLRFPRLDVFELPLLAVIFFSVAWRSPMAGTLLGAAVGLFQDGLSHQPFGVNGIAKTTVGFLAASLSLKIDVESQVTRLLMNFGFTLLHGFLLFALLRHFVAVEAGWSWTHELLKAGLNAVLGVLLFALLDRTRRQE